MRASVATVAVRASPPAERAPPYPVMPLSGRGARWQSYAPHSVEMAKSRGWRAQVADERALAFLR
jgi:hypothetical protein